MPRQEERDYESERNELLQKAFDERRRGREGVALCLEKMASDFQSKVDEKYLAQYQE